ncbi:MAG: hypothetical protein LBJ12_00180 [Oscillospiraceae bacterium]|nr:hypothetical protein [Oscillospiraceae bacterium]
MDLPISPGCSIFGCFCNRKLCADEVRSGVDDKPIPAIAQAARMLNIVLPIPRHKLSAPDYGQIGTAHAHVEERLTIFRHCARCRADAARVKTWPHKSTAQRQELRTHFRMAEHHLQG